MDAELEKKLNRRAALWSLALTGGGFFALREFHRRVPKGEGDLPGPLLAMHRVNESIARTVLPPSRGRDREFSPTEAVEPRNNYHGATPEIDLDAWRLTLGKRSISLAELKELPEVVQTTELKCVEGWSAIVTWSGARFADFYKKYPPPQPVEYVSIRSEPEGFEDDWYYVGLDLESCLHPQTLLAWGMNGAPLTPAHGAPLRLFLPHKYGIKSIKLITTIEYARERPADYWAERGYDWYAGL